MEPTGERDKVPEVVLVKEKLTDSEGTAEPDGALKVEFALALVVTVTVGEAVAVIEDDADAVDEIVRPSTVKVKLEVTVPDTALVTETDCVFDMVFVGDGVPDPVITAEVVPTEAVADRDWGPDAVALRHSDIELV